MFDPAIDGWYAWVGVAAVSVAVAGTALAFPTAAPPTADPVADTVDSVAASPHDARTTVELSVESVRLGPHSIALRDGGATATAVFEFGPVTPVEGGPLGRVLAGTSPREVFGSKSAFGTALTGAADRRLGWRPASGRLVVRRVAWGELNATLVG